MIFVIAYDMGIELRSYYQIVRHTPVRKKKQEEKVAGKSSGFTVFALLVLLGMTATVEAAVLPKGTVDLSVNSHFGGVPDLVEV